MKYREFVHGAALVYVYIVLGSAAFLLLIFPFFFRGNLVTPLRRLLEGVRLVNQGELSVQVPVRVEDEIGFLSRSFNKMVESIRDLNMGLEGKVKERTTQLEDAYEKLQEVDRLKNRMFTNISHEIRTPLTLILGPLETLLKKKDDFKSEHLDLLFTIKKNGRFLLKLINDLLDLAKFDAGKMQLRYRKVELRNYLEHLSSYFNPIAANKNIDFKVQGHSELYLFVDSTLLEKVVLNMLSNSFKFTGRGFVTVQLQGFIIAARRLIPELIISDLMMPKMDGMSMLRKIKRDEKLAMIPFLFLTAKVDIEEKMQGLECGADDYISKPFRPEELKLKIRNLLHCTSLFELNVMKEREHIYANLYDYLGGSLTDLAMLTQRFKTVLAGDEALLRELEENVQDTVRYKQCFLEVEDLNILKEDFLDGIQLVLLRRYANFQRQIEFSGAQGLKAIFLNRNNDPVKQVIYSVCLETATNDLKYGKGISIWTLGLKEAEYPFFTLSVEAESEYEQLEKSSGHGSVNIQERVLSMGGRVERSL